MTAKTSIAALCLFILSSVTSVATAAGASKVVACQNTMKAKKLSQDQMNMSIGYVPAGVIQIMTRQGQGWAYVRP
ncbi:MAG: DsrE family protein [Proteobacteria bacterium]|nr:DsrE family protein [Pseudomonadota bacterium]MDA0869845.1 DsrE family protein [Pseudomonadota bacterium]MDA1328806.1 DsrE family protein [Pseudomonadota bacterium]